MATHSSILAWKIPWTEEPGRLQSMGSQRVRHDFTFTFIEMIIQGFLYFLLWYAHVFSNESTLHMRWPMYWSFNSNIDPSKNTQDWSPLEWTVWVFLQSKGVSRVFSNTTVIEIKLVAFFVADDGEAVHTQEKQDLELIVTRSSASHRKIQA